MITHYYYFFFQIPILNQQRHLDTWQQVCQTKLQFAIMTLTMIILDCRQGPPSKKIRLDASEPSAFGSSTAGPSSASGLDTKLGEWKSK